MGTCISITAPSSFHLPPSLAVECGFLVGIPCVARFVAWEFLVALPSINMDMRAEPSFMNQSDFPMTYLDLFRVTDKSKPLKSNIPNTLGSFTDIELAEKTCG